MNYKNNKLQESPYSHYRNVANEAVTLQIFNIITENPEISERKISQRTGLAAGLVHSFMRRIVSKGWVRAKQVNAKRWLYFMTPDGFMEKGRLCLKYLEATLNSYKLASEVARNQLEFCLQQKAHRLVVAGQNELAEIMVLSIKAIGSVRLEGVISGKQTTDMVAGIPVSSYGVFRAWDFDMVLVCDLEFLVWLKDNKIDLPPGKVANVMDRFSTAKMYGV